MCVLLLLFQLLLLFLDSNLTIHQDHSTWNLAFYLCAPGSTRAPTWLLKIATVEPHPRLGPGLPWRPKSGTILLNLIQILKTLNLCMFSANMFKVGQSALEKCQIGQIWVQIGQICQIGNLIGQIEQTPDTSKMKILMDIYQIYF